MGLDFLEAVRHTGGTVADLGMGTESLVYISRSPSPPKTFMADISRFNVALNTKFSELNGRTDLYEVLQCDLTADPLSGGFAPASIAHAQANQLTHHLNEAGIEGLFDYLKYILTPNGTFSLWDHTDDFESPERIVALLKKHGLTGRLNPSHDGIDNEGEPVLRKFAIEGRKI